MTSNSASNISTTNLTCASFYFDSDKWICRHMPSLSHSHFGLFRTVECCFSFLLIPFPICYGTHRVYGREQHTYSEMNYYCYSILRSMPNAIVVFMVFKVTTMSVTVSVWITNVKRNKLSQRTHRTDMQSDYTANFFVPFCMQRRTTQQQANRIFVSFSFSLVCLFVCFLFSKWFRIIPKCFRICMCTYGQHRIFE